MTQPPWKTVQQFLIQQHILRNTAKKMDGQFHSHIEPEGHTEGMGEEELCQKQVIYRIS